MGSLKSIGLGAHLQEEACPVSGMYHCLMQALVVQVWTDPRHALMNIAQVLLRLAVQCFEVGASLPDAGKLIKLVKAFRWPPAAGSKPLLLVTEDQQEDPAGAAVEGLLHCQMTSEVGTERGELHYARGIGISVLSGAVSVTDGFHI